MATDWQRSLIILTWVVVATLVIIALYFGRSIFIPIALAIFLTFVLSPLTARLQRRRMGRGPAVLLTVMAAAAIVAVTGFMISMQLISLAETLPDHKEVILTKITRAKTAILGDGDSRMGQLVNDIYQHIFPPPPAEDAPLKVDITNDSPTDHLSTFISPAAEFAGQAALSMILCVFMLLKKEDLRNRMIRLTGDGKVTTTTRAVDDVSSRISRYLLMQLFINAGFGVIITLGLLLLGVEYALLWGFIAMVMRYVPYLGTPLGLIPPVLFSFATSPDWGGGFGQPMAVFALFVILELIGNNVFEPWLFGKSLGVSEVAQLVAIGFWALMWGPIGVVLSGPITVCLVVLGRHVKRFTFLEVLLGDQPALSPPVAFYQRLAARDQDEAAEIALAVSSETSQVACLDTVVVPALCIARRDLADGDLDVNDFRFAVRAAREIAVELNDLEGIPTKEFVRENENRVRILILPAHDEAEHVAADAFASTLDSNRWEVRVAGDETLASEMVATAREFDPAVVVIATLPPGGISHSRYLSGRLRAHFPTTKLFFGRWGWECSEPETIGELGRGIDGVDRTMTETRNRLESLHAVLATRAATEMADKAEQAKGRKSEGGMKELAQ